MQQNNELDIQFILSTLARYKWSIFLTTLLFTLAVTAYAYFLVPIYSTSTLISIENEKASKLDFLLPGASSQFKVEDDLDTNIRILKSRNIISKVLKKINLEIRYFIRYKYKILERTNFPFNVELSNPGRIIKNATYKLVPIDKTSFILTNEKTGYNKTHHFGELITLDLYAIKINKISGPLDAPYYLFKINTDKLDLTQNIIRNLKVTKPSDSLLQLTYTDTLPNRAKKIVDEIANIYIEYQLDDKTLENEKTLTFLDERLSFMQNTLKNYGKKLQTFQSENIRASAATADGNVLSKLMTNEEKLATIKSKLNTLREVKSKKRQNFIDVFALQSSGIDTNQLNTWIGAIREKKEKLSLLRAQQSDQSVSITANAELNVLLQVSRDKEKLLQLLSQDFTSSHPRIIQLNKELQLIKTNINKYFSKNISRLQNEAGQLDSYIKKSIAEIHNTMASQNSMLTREIQKDEKTLEALPAIKMKLGDLKRNFTLTENIYSFLLEKRMEIELSKASIVSNTKVIDDALIPKIPIKPNKKFLVVAGFLVGLILGIALAFLRAMMDNKIRTSEELEKLTSIPIYGIIPLFKNKYAFKESFRALRTNVQFTIPKHGDCKVIMVSSSIPKEGKTTISSGLSKILSIASQKVLVMDLDMRKPRLHEELEFNNKMGISDVLVENYSLEEVTIPVNNHLDFLPAGPVAPNPAELLISTKFDTIMHTLMKKYDYIVIDTSPIGLISDANTLLKYIDLMLLVTKSNYTEKGLIKEFNKMVEEKDIQSIGLILNSATQEKKSGYGYGYGYDYGYGYGYGYEEENEKKTKTKQKRGASTSFYTL